MLILLEHPLSPYVQKVKIALREKGVEFTSHIPKGMATGKTTGEFALKTIRGEVPELIDDNRRISDSTIILEFIEMRWPDPALLPADPYEAARARMIEDVMDTHYEAINWGVFELEFFGRAEGERKEQLLETARTQISGFHRWLEGELQSSGWFVGDSFGWADLSVLPFINGSASFGVAPPEGSRLATWQAAANARESVVKTMEEAEREIENMGQIRQDFDKGNLRREYRDHRLEWMMKSGGIDVVFEGLKAGNIRFSVEEMG